MKITSFKIHNYRTLESIDLTFPSSYAAIQEGTGCQPKRVKPPVCPVTGIAAAATPAPVRPAAYPPR